MKPETRTKRELRELQKEFNEVKENKPVDTEHLASLSAKMAIKALVFLTVTLDPESDACDIANLGLYGFDRKWE